MYWYVLVHTQCLTVPVHTTPYVYICILRLSASYVERRMNEQKNERTASIVYRVLYDQTVTKKRTSERPPPPSTSFTNHSIHGMGLRPVISKDVTSSLNCLSVVEPALLFFPLTRMMSSSRLVPASRVVAARVLNAFERRRHVFETHLHSPL